MHGSVHMNLQNQPITLKQLVLLKHLVVTICIHFSLHNIILNWRLTQYTIFLLYGQ